MIKIDTGVPIPSKESEQGNLKYPFRDMRFGDSIFIPGINHGLHRIFARYKPMKFIQRKVSEDGVVGIRVWRIA